MKTLIIDGNNLVHRTFWTAKTQSKRTGVDDPVQIANFHIYFTLNAIYSYIVYGLLYNLPSNSYV